MKSAPASRYARPMSRMISGLVRVRRSLLPFSSLRMIAEALAAKIVLAQLEALDHHAPGAVEQQEALLRFLLHPGDAGGAVETHDKSFGLNPKHAAGRIGQIGLVEGVEMKLVEAAAAQLLHLIGQHGGSDDAAAFDIFVQPVIGTRQPGGNGRAASWPPCARRRGNSVVGMMPGTIGMVMPALAASSRKRAIASLSKQNWPSARLAPASILRLQQFDVVAVARANRDGARDRRRR